MKIDLVDQNHIKNLVTELKQQFNISTPSDIRIYFGLSHAVNEVTRGIARMFPHKRSIAIIKGCSPFFDEIKIFFSMEGYQIQEIDFAIANKNAEWVDTLKKDCLFVLSAEDDPATGQIFDFKLHLATLDSKKIFNICISHNLYKFEKPAPPQSYEVKVLSGSTTTACALLGERSPKIEPLIYGPTAWPLDFTSHFSSSNTEGNKKKILNLEASISAAPLFLNKEARIYDRAVFYWTDMDGEAFISELAAVLNLKIGAPSIEHKIETTSLCRWDSLKATHWLKLQGYSEQVIRGLVVIDADLIDSHLASNIQKARNYVESYTE